MGREEYENRQLRAHEQTQRSPYILGMGPGSKYYDNGQYARFALGVFVGVVMGFIAAVILAAAFPDVFSATRELMNSLLTSFRN